MQIEGASALVTGASRGIGRAIALGLARAGARVTALARSEAELGALTAEAVGLRTGARSLHIQPFAADLLSPETADRAVQAARERYGPLRILVNNAGVTVHKPLAETTDAEWDAVIGTNLSAVFRLTRAALPDLARDGGHVFMISSLAGTNAIAGLASYCASKAALDHLAACLMLEVRQQGVKVTTIAPGSVNTGFGGRSGDGTWMIQPDDIASTLLELLRMPDGTHSSRVEMRPARPRNR